MDLTSMKLDTGDHSPISQQPYRPPDRMLEGFKEEIDTLLESDNITSSTSPWACLIIPVKKPNRKVRLCIDFR